MYQCLFHRRQLSERDLPIRQLLLEQLQLLVICNVGDLQRITEVMKHQTEWKMSTVYEHCTIFFNLLRFGDVSRELRPRNRNQSCIANLDILHSTNIQLEGAAVVICHRLRPDLWIITRVTN